MSHAYTEDQLVEQPAIGLFTALGWQTISALEETFGTAGTLGRETKTRGQSLGFCSIPQGSKPLAGGKRSATSG
jgi:hypothetical protein